MKILVTGSNGFLGKLLVKAFSKCYEVFQLSRNNSDYNFDLEKSIPGFDNKFDLVIHAAGKAHSVPKTSLEKQAFFDVNFKGTQNLLRGIEESQSLPKAFIFISTVAVYGKDIGVNISENEPLLAKDSYGLSKIQAEQLVLDWCKMHNVICTILRLPLLVGHNPPGNLGAMIKAIQLGYYFNIDGGKAHKSMVLAEDVVRCIFKVADIGGIYNLTDGSHPSFEHLSNHISIQLGKKKPMNMPLWLARVIASLGDLLGSKAPINTYKLNKVTSDLTFDDTNARETFGWNPSPVLERFKIKVE
jgi:nucleoside-diphosphate-sugar epimerase